MNEDFTPPPNSIWTTCKDCGKPYAFSRSSMFQDQLAGRNAPERCTGHVKTHAAEMNSIAVPHFAARGRDGGPVPAGISTGRLGKIYHPDRVHTSVEPSPSLDEEIRGAGVTEENLDDLFTALSERQVVIVEGGTGSGKSTYVPCRLVEPGTADRAALWRPRGPIVITQPRIQATTSIPKRVPELLGCGVGPWLDVGFRYHGDDQSSLLRNRLIFMTDGVLLNWLLDGRTIDRLSAIMIDEAHERSLNIDIILALLRRLLPRHPHVKVIIASATIKAARFRRFFGDLTAVEDDSEPGAPAAEAETIVDAAVPLIHCEANTHGYQVHHRIDERRELRYDRAVARGQVDQDLARHIANALIEKVVEVLRATPEDRADILGFVATKNAVGEGIRRIREAIDGDDTMEHVDVFPLHGDVPKEERDRATETKDDPGRRRVIIATNIAETSLTIEDLGYVVDSGIILQTYWNDGEETLDYPTIVHSKAGCRQRWGRVGRTSPGHVYTVYTEEQFKMFPDDTKPEITRASLESLVLKIKSAGLEPDDMEWLEPPVGEALVAAARRLERSDLLDSRGRLTPLGIEMRQGTLDATSARLLVETDRFASSVEMATLLAMRKDDCLLRSSDWDAITRLLAARAHRALMDGLRDDLELLLKIYAGWDGQLAASAEHDQEAWARRWFINQSAMEEASKRRAEYLLPYAVHGKEEEDRAIDFSLLGRVRHLVATYAPNWRFRPKGRMWVGDEREVEAALGQVTCVKPGAQEILALTTRRRSGRLVIGKALLPVEPLLADGPLLDRALALTSSVRGDDGGLLDDRDEEWLRIVIDQLAAPGTRFRIAAPITPPIELTEPIASPKEPVTATRDLPPAPDLSAGEPGAGDPPRQDKDVPFSSDAVSAAGAGHGLDGPIAPDDREGDPDEAGEGPGTRESGAGERSRAARLLERLLPVRARLEGEPRQAADDTTVVEVRGYDRTAEQPEALVRASTDPAPLDRLIAEFSVGDEIEVVVEAVELFDKDAILVTREATTDAEVLFEPEDVTFDGFAWALRHLDPGTRLTARITTLAPEAGGVRASLLPTVQQQRAAALGDRSARRSAVIGKVGGGELEALLLPVSRDHPALETLSIPAGRGPRRQLEVGETVEVRLERRNASVYVPSVPPGFVAEDLHPSLHWHAEREHLEFRGQMYDADRSEMCASASSSGVRRAIEDLYRHSNRWRGVVADDEANAEFLKVHSAGSFVEVTVLSARPASVLVETPDGRVWSIPRRELSLDPHPKVRDFSAGRVLQAKVLEGADGVTLSIREAMPDPFEQYRASAGEDAWFDGTIRHVDHKRGMHVTLKGSIRGYLPWQAVPDGSRDADARFARGQSIRARVEEAYADSRMTRLSQKPLQRRPAAPAAVRDDEIERAVEDCLPEAMPVSAVREEYYVQGQGARHVGAMILLRDMAAYRRTAGACVAEAARLDWVRFAEWSDDPDQLLRNMMKRPDPSGAVDIVRKLDWRRYRDEAFGARVEVMPGARGHAVDVGGIRVRLAARALRLRRIDIHESGSPAT